MPDKRALARAICQKTTEALGIAGDDVFMALIPVPKENFSFGRTALAPTPEPDADHGHNKNPA
ncbi:tautomerase family protein [Streptomyces sp. NEAU-S77]|uniref:tautomerase family protein n=1 Tax=Streptomyces sp. NEAU-S77 TaxID=3411033 RepID=UPI003BA361B7